MPNPSLIVGLRNDVCANHRATFQLRRTAEFQDIVGKGLPTYPSDREHAAASCEAGPGATRQDQRVRRVSRNWRGLTPACRLNAALKWL